jgi:Domain of unknown function (DUF4287)
MDLPARANNGKIRGYDLGLMGARSQCSNEETPMPSKASAKKSPYVLHPAYAYVESIVAGLSERTGKILEEWIRIVKESGIAGAKERTAWLKSQYGLGMTSAGVIVERAEGRGGRLPSRRAGCRPVLGTARGPAARVRTPVEARLRIGEGHESLPVQDLRALVPEPRDRANQTGHRHTN